MEKPPLPKASDNPPRPREVVEWVDKFIPDGYELGERMVDLTLDEGEGCEMPR